LCRVSVTGSATLPVPLTRHEIKRFHFPGVSLRSHPWLSSEAADAALVHQSQKTSANDTDRLAECLARFGLDWKSVHDDTIGRSAALIALLSAHGH